MPVSGNIRNFRFRGVDGRGHPRLVQEPASGNFYVAVVNVQDPKGGGGGYTFDLTWEWDGYAGGGGGGIFSDQPTTLPAPLPTRPTTRPTPVAPGPVSLRDMNVTMAGDGTLDDGSQQYNVTGLNLRITGEQCRITLITSSNRGRIDASALMLGIGNSVTEVRTQGNINGRNFQSNFRSR